MSCSQWFLYNPNVTLTEEVPVNEYEAMLRAAPTTADGGNFVLFEGKNQFIGQFKITEDTANHIKESNTKFDNVRF